MIEEILIKIYTSEILSSEELHELTEWIREPKDRIDKAIEYIEENLLNEESKDYCNLCKEDNIKIINILKGVDKE